MPPIQFPPEIQSALARAMRDVARGVGASADMRLLAARDLVCRHVHDLAVTPEVMVIAVRDVYRSIVLSDVRDRERLRGSFDLLMSGWVQAYVDEAERRAIEG